MAFYAWYKRVVYFRKAPYTNWIDWYRKQLYDEWFESLSEEEKDKVIRLQEAKKKKREKELKTLMNSFAGVMCQLALSALENS